jgi:LCP family protein required for cell wall assembly
MTPRKLSLPRFLAFLVFFFVLLLFIVTGTGYLVLHSFSRQTGEPVSYFLNTALSAYQEFRQSGQKRLNFLVLGMERRDDWLEKTETTDTIMFISYDLATSKISLLSIPRDLWLYPINAKVNQVYPQSHHDNSIDYGFIKESYRQLLGQPIDYVVIVETQNLANLVQLVGGVNVYLSQGFKDTQYPNPDYISNPTPGTPVYITVEFASGNNLINQTNLAPFVRSRHGAETAAQGGTDLGRIQRQQLLLQAIFQKLTDRNFLFDLNHLASLYNYFHQEIKTTLTDKDLLVLALLAKDGYQKASFQKIDIPVGLSPKDGLIYHPNSLFHSQWVFLPSDPSYQQLQQFLQSKLN